MNSGYRQMVVGVALLGVGVVASIGISALTSGAGVLLVATGLLGAGFAYFARGFVEVRHAREERDRAALPGNALEQWLSPAAVRARWARRLAWLVSAILVVGIVVVSSDVLDKLKYDCADGMTGSVEKRQSAMRRVQGRLRWLRWAPASAVSYCASVEEDLARIDRGLCPWNPVAGLTCRCGDKEFPKDVHCPEPHCSPAGGFSESCTASLGSER